MNLLKEDGVKIALIECIKANLSYLETDDLIDFMRQVKSLITNKNVSKNEVKIDNTVEQKEDASIKERGNAVFGDVVTSDKVVEIKELTAKTESNVIPGSVDENPSPIEKVKRTRRKKAEIEAERQAKASNTKTDTKAAPQETDFGLEVIPPTTEISAPATPSVTPAVKEKSSNEKAFKAFIKESGDGTEFDLEFGDIENTDSDKPVLKPVETTPPPVTDVLPAQETLVSEDDEVGPNNIILKLAEEQKRQDLEEAKQAITVSLQDDIITTKIVSEELPKDTSKIESATPTKIASVKQDDDDLGDLKKVRLDDTDDLDSLDFDFN